MDIFRCLAPAAVVTAVVTAAVTGLGGSAVVADAASLSGSGPGTNIGNAAVLTGTVSGSLPSGLAEGWFVVYPAQAGGTVVFKVTDTTSSSSPCSSIAFSIDNTDGSGGVITNGTLGAGGSYEHPQSAPGSDRYYVEVSPFNCSPTGGQPATYSVAVVSGGGGTAPNPATGTIKAGKSIGAVGSPLRGHMVYRGSLGAVPDAWYQLDAKASGATIRVENTTVAGSPCATIRASYDNADGSGGVIANPVQGDNSAVTFTATAAGLYYIELNAFNCTATAATTYSVEPEPGTGWAVPAPPTTGTISAGTSIGTVGPPLQGDTLYRGSVSSVPDAWYQLDAKASGATIRVENTTVAGSPCATIRASYDNADGSGGVIANPVQGDNSAVTFTATAAGLYYIELNAFNCTATAATTYSVEPSPSTKWATPAPPATGTIKAGKSIGAVGSPLRGHMVYRGSLGAVPDAWYQLDAKASGATIRVENTTIAGSPCATIRASYDNADGSGGVIANPVQGDNSAVTFTATAAGLYYIELNAFNCTATAATTYSVEPEPGTGWAVPAPPTTGTISAGTSIGTVGPPLQGDTLYKGTAATSTSQAWYQLDKAADANTATIRVENTTVTGSACATIQVTLENSSGGVIANPVQGDNSAVTFTVTAAGLYYIEITAFNCTATQATTYSIEPNPSSEWTATPTAGASATNITRLPAAPAAARRR